MPSGNGFLRESHVSPISGSSSTRDVSRRSEANRRSLQHHSHFRFTRFQKTYKEVEFSIMALNKSIRLLLLQPLQSYCSLYNQFSIDRGHSIQPWRQHRKSLNQHPHPTSRSHLSLTKRRRSKRFHLRRTRQMKANFRYGQHSH